MSGKILNHFFTNTDKPIFALKNMPPAIQAYIYMGVSRFPNVRKRFLEFTSKKCNTRELNDKIINQEPINQELEPFSEFAAKQNTKIYFDFGHKSAGEGSTVFVVSEDNPIYATEIQQDFYFPMTTMELSTRYSKSFNIDRIYWDPQLLESKFAEQAREIVKENFRLYNEGFDILKDEFSGDKELPEKVSILDSLRSLIPLAAYTTVILGGNTRSVMEHFSKLLTSKDSYIRYYTRSAIKELSKLMPEYFSKVTAKTSLAESNQKLRQKSKELFKDKFVESSKTVELHYELPTENLALVQLLYPHCHLTFGQLLEEVRSMSENEKKEIFDLANYNRKNRENPQRGFITYPLVYEINSSWRLWKDFKRNRMNTRFHQKMRGKSGYEISELLKNSQLRSDYERAMKSTSKMIEELYQENPQLAKTVAAQGSGKRFLLCMHPHQLTVLGELRTCGEGDKGYRKIASKMIQLAKEKNPRLFSHINDNFKPSL